MGLGFKVWGLGFTVWGRGSRCSRFRVQEAFFIARLGLYKATPSQRTKPHNAGFQLTYDSDSGKAQHLENDGMHIKREHLFRV